jgi:hypothetical protein
LISLRLSVCVQGQAAKKKTQKAAAMMLSFGEELEDGEEETVLRSMEEVTAQRLKEERQTSVKETRQARVAPVRPRQEQALSLHGQCLAI